MRIRVSLSAWRASFALSLGLTACGGSTDVNAFDGDGGAGGGAPFPPFPCRNPEPVLDAAGEPSGIERCADGSLHRVDAEVCASALPRTERLDGCGANASLGLGCATDRECTDGAHGMCSADVSGVCSCRYGCLSDSDCRDGSVCECGSVIGRCVPAGCRTDSDCEGSLQCRTYQDPDGSFCGDRAYQCQHPNDECATDSDCGDGLTGFCLADASGVHRCVSDFGCGIPGRPFLVNGLAVTAAPSERSGWSERAQQIPRVDNAALRARIADHFTHAGLMEHASIAAFARFTLQLLGLGAPADLVEASNRAIRDETEHARLCFALAEGYSGRPVGPGPLPVEGVTAGSVNLADVLETVVREGCVGETVAAFEAAEAREHAEDLEVQRVLARIAEDERRHAELAWRFVEWAIAEDVALAGVVVESIDKECTRLGLTAQRRGVEQADPADAAHGVLPESYRRHVAVRVAEEIVRPLAAHLVEKRQVA